jgi:hypothetical protein
VLWWSLVSGLRRRICCGDVERFRASSRAVSESLGCEVPPSGCELARAASESLCWGVLRTDTAGVFVCENEIRPYKRLSDELKAPPPKDASDLPNPDKLWLALVPVIRG